jgi:hypothetical protein
MTASLSQGRTQTPNYHSQSPLYPKNLALALIGQTNHLQWPSCIPFDRPKAIEEHILYNHGAYPNLPSE